MSVWVSVYRLFTFFIKETQSPGQLAAAAGWFAGCRARSELCAEDLEEGEQSGCAFISEALPLIGTDHIWCQHRERRTGALESTVLHLVLKTRDAQSAEKTAPQTGVWKDLVSLAFSVSSSTAGQKSKQKTRPALSPFFADTQVGACFLPEHSWEGVVSIQMQPRAFKGKQRLMGRVNSVRR